MHGCPARIVQFRILQRIHLMHYEFSTRYFDSDSYRLVSGD